MVRMDHGADKRAVYTVHTPTSQMTFRLLPGHHAHYAMDIRRWVAAQRGTVTASVHTTVASNVAQYSKQDVKDARAARQTLRCFGLPDVNRLTAHIGHLRNINTTPRALRLQQNIAGLSLAAVRGKTTQPRMYSSLATYVIRIRAFPIRALFYSSPVSERRLVMNRLNV